MVPILIALGTILIATPAFGQTYDVTTFTYAFGEAGPRIASSTERIQITDRGAKFVPRWTTPSLGQLAVSEFPREPWGSGTIFDGSCGSLFPFVWGFTRPVQLDAQTVEVQGSVDFAWLGNTEDPHAFFCLKQGRMVQDVWIESMSFGRRISVPERVHSSDRRYVSRLIRIQSRRGSSE